MKIALRILAVLAVANIASACASFNSIFRSSDFGKDATVVSLDAKQRIVLTKGTDIGDVACAEPSPDALSAYGASFSAGVEKEVVAKLAAAMAEQATNIGLRTQSIQLLRDSMYRICEGYYSRALNQEQFMLLQQRYQNIMVALLAIEQLTGTVTHRGDPIGVDSKAETAPGAAPAATPASDRPAGASSAIGAKGSAPSASAKPALGTADGTQSGGRSTGPTEAQLANIATTVENIVRTVIERDNTVDACVAFLTVSYSELVILADRIEKVGKEPQAPEPAADPRVKALKESLEEKQKVRDFCMEYLRAHQRAELSRVPARRAQ